jgi:aminopeptidase N
MYAYPKMVAADAADGMEYPMITLDGGRDPGYRGLLVHEIGHNWFYGMVGSNETYRAAMDEGFTQFLTAWGLKRIEGESVKAGVPEPFFSRKGEAIPTIDRNVILPYTMAALQQNELPINTHSDDFRNATGHENGYGMVYYKTATMLYNLQYVLGDSLFLQTMRHYFDQWKMAHPYFEDFRNSVIQFTHQDLNWFFDEWFETTKTIDYGIRKVKKVSGSDSVDITFRRRGQTQMPVQFTVTAKDNSRQTYLIPNTWNTPPDARQILPRWIGWGQLQPRHTARIAAPSGIREVQIDTTYRLADIYYPDNSFRTGLGIGKGVATRFDWGMKLSTDRRRYRVSVRPDLWGNAVDGFKAGIHAEGDYLGLMHRFEATVWYNTHLLQQDRYLSYRSEGWYDRYLPLAYTFNYASPITRFYPKLQWNLSSRINDGFNRHGVGLSWQVNDRNILSGSFLSLWRQRSYDLDYLLYPQEWSSVGARINTSINLGWTYLPAVRKGTGSLSLTVRAPFMTGKQDNAFDYSYVQGEAKRSWNWGRTEWRTRLFGRYGLGDNIPWESALYAAGANPEALMENKFLRSAGFVPTDWTGYSATTTNHLQQGGGLNLRGYAGYLIAEEQNGQILLGYKSRSGAAFNAEMDFDGLVKFQPKAFRNWLHFDTYLFADAGLMELSRYDSLSTYAALTPANRWSGVRADAGVGVAMTIKKFGKLDKAKPLTLRFDMPVFLSHPPAGEDYLKFRYVVGIGRTF